MSDLKGRAGLTTVLASEIEAADGRLFDRGENLFLFLRGREDACQLLSDREEVFGRPITAFAVLRFNPLDFLGRRCTHCDALVEQLDDLGLWLQRGKLGGTFHETCFRKWFVLQDKEALQPYRFARLDACNLALPGGHGKLRIGRQLTAGPAAVDLVAELPFAQIAVASEDAERVATEKAVHIEGRTSEANLIICPRCDAPNRIPFLDTEGVHRCDKCSGRFRIRIEEIAD